MSGDEERDYIPDVPQCIILDKFDQFDLYRYNAIGDGSCFFHSVLMGINECYRKGKTKDGKPLSRRELAKLARVKIADMLSAEVSPGGPKYYDVISNGELSDFARQFSMVKLERLKSLLKSDNHVGQEVIEITSLFFKVNIFIIDISTGDLYKTLVPFNKEFNSNVVLIYTGNHYDLCGVVRKNGKIDTHLKTTHKFIQHCLKLM